MLTSRERVLCALNHEEPDRVPVFFGATGSTSIHAKGYDKIKKRLGIQSETKLISRADRYTLLDRKVIEHYGGDGIPFYAKAAPSTLSKVISEEAFIDEWGIRWQQEPGGVYFSPPYKGMPLENATLDDIEKYPWPQVAHPSRFAGIREEVRKLRETTDYAIIGSIGPNTVEKILHLRGLENTMVDMAMNQDFFLALLGKITSLMVEATDQFLDAVGDYIDIYLMGDDMGTQNAPMFSPQMYRDLVKPSHAALIEKVHQKSKAKIFFHTCGDVYPLMEDLIDVGVDLLNPVQVSAKDMGDTARLKREFGDRISFCGGIDTQTVLPKGTPAEVRAEVRRRIKDLAPGGGYVLAAVHSIQPDVPLENIEAMLDEAKKSGQYPIKL